MNRTHPLALPLCVAGLFVLAITTGAGQPVFPSSTTKSSCDVTLSAPLAFSMPITVCTADSATGLEVCRQLFLGMGRYATTGCEADVPGRLDSQYCERELPPRTSAAFDVRWVIPGRNGLLYSIYPMDNPAGGFRWHAQYQTAHTTGTWLASPVVIRWSREDAARSPYHLYLRDPNWNDTTEAGLLSVDMRMGNNRSATGTMVRRIGPDTIEAVIATRAMNGFTVVMVSNETPRDPNDLYDPLAATLYCEPNPFTSELRVAWRTTFPDTIRIDILSSRGDLVRTLVNARREAGTSSTRWDGTDTEGRRCLSGSYRCRLSTSTETLTRVIVLVR